ncbi:DNA-binding response regulator [Sphingobacterium faecium NBRC 15299]|jgi:DNA-binding response OmpR family regulator|uniref:response regulator transcription factor n=1 Tax=Sphingobacterium faecium TaxID=34087 RepID=UPI000D389A37|nr:response regulator transcription factor [Sphingobacterium faecium]PTX13588.1 DNA-binding response OmpR family regulator [Sphingobacterium faecium]GEM65282.1 DNA-binding response regulator [Sphingobacterium faecium NBRC 15299]
MKILIVEDDQRVAELIKRGLEEQGFEATLAYDGLSGKKLSSQDQFDLVITDIILPKMDGLDLCKYIRQTNPDLPIIMLTALGTTDDKVEGFDAGADDYLVKPFEMRELLVRIRALLKRNQKKSGNMNVILVYEDLEMNLHTKMVKRNQQQISLTPKEFKLLAYLMQNPERVLSRVEIADKVWETHFDTGTNFIDVYINYLRKKIDRNFDKKLIHTKSGMGFILKTES